MDTQRARRWQIRGVGALMGFLLVISLISTGGITGFVVFGGEQVVLIGETVTTSTIIPLNIPDDISRMTLQGRYVGSGSVSIQLVGPDEMYHVGTYHAPQFPRDNTFILKKGGTVVSIEEEELIYRHAFRNACDDTCDEEMKGPFYLQIGVEGGELSLNSLTYESPQAISRPVEPDTPEDVEIVIPEPQPLRINPVSDCSIDSDCGSEYMCHVGYCISETGHFNITDNEERVVALVDKFGRILLAGDVIQNTAEIAPENSFRIQDDVQNIAWVTSDGDLHLLGVLLEEVVEVDIVGENNFVIRNSTDNVAMVQGTTGNLFTMNVLVENVLE